jgi:16S rRNA processing protein RimM
VLHIHRGGGPDQVTVERVRFHRGRPIVGLSGVGTMDAAEALAGLELRVSEDALQPLPAGSFYRHDLIGCAVVTPDGQTVGRVKDVEGEAAGSRLVVESGAGDVLIPMAQGICAEIDVAGRKIVVEPPEGLLELNVTKRQRF